MWGPGDLWQRLLHPPRVFHSLDVPRCCHRSNRRGPNVSVCTVLSGVLGVCKPKALLCPLSSALSLRHTSRTAFSNDCTRVVATVLPLSLSRCCCLPRGCPGALNKQHPGPTQAQRAALQLAVAAIVFSCLCGPSDGFMPYTVATEVGSPTCVYAADVDGDSRVDVLSASEDDNKIAWFKNGGGSTPSWTRYVISSSATGARSVYATDVNGDGRVDVLSASASNNKIAWYKNGGGTPPSWTSHTITTSASDAQSVFAADVNGDGRVDVLSASWDDDTIAWYRNGGGSTPSWTTRTITTEAIGATSVFARDVNGDGLLDVLSASIDAITWYQNSGGSVPTWTALTITASASTFTSVFARDVDGDGRVDVLSSSLNDNTIVWYKNGGGSVPSWTKFTISTTALRATSVFATDVDGDGRVDVLSASWDDHKIAWYWNEGGSPPTWRARAISTNDRNAASVYASDLNGDGRVDVLSATWGYDSISWYQHVPCPAGSHFRGSACEACPAGQFSTNGVLCRECPAGRFGAATGMSVVACSGSCTAGFACPDGSTSATAVECPAGRYVRLYAVWGGLSRWVGRFEHCRTGRLYRAQDVRIE